MHFRHRWAIVETIGCVVTFECICCPKRRTRICAPVRESARTPTPDCPDRPETGSQAATAPPRCTCADAVPHRTPPARDEIDNASPDYHG